MWSHFPRLVGVFLMFGFEWSLLVKIIYGLGGSVYNLNNVPLDVDPKCIFVVQIYYRVFFVVFFLLFFLIIQFKTKQKERFCFDFLSLFGAWDGAGGAVTSCLKLHDYHQTICSSDSTSVSAVSFLLFSLSDSKCKRYILMSSRPA